MAAQPLKRALCRHLARACRHLDVQPALHPLRPALAFVRMPEHTPLSPFSAAEHAEIHSHVQSIMRILLGGHSYATQAGHLYSNAMMGLRDGASTHTHGSEAAVWNAICHVVRSIQLMTQEGKALLSRESNAEVMSALAAAGSSVRSRLRSCACVHTLSPGILMVEDAASQVAPQRTLVQVYDISQNLQEVHGNTAWKVRGFMANLPLHGSVSALTKRQDLGPLGDLPLYYGGPASKHMGILHRIPDISGAAAVDGTEEQGAAADVLQAGPCGLFVGGALDEINAALKSGTASSDDVKVLYGSVEFDLVDAGEGLQMEDADRFSYLAGPGVGDLVLHDGRGIDAPNTAQAPQWQQHALWQAAYGLVAREPVQESSECLPLPALKEVQGRLAALQPLRIA